VVQLVLVGAWLEDGGIGGGCGITSGVMGGIWGTECRQSHPNDSWWNLRIFLEESLCLSPLIPMNTSQSNDNSIFLWSPIICFKGLVVPDLQFSVLSSMNEKMIKLDHLLLQGLLYVLMLATSRRDSLINTYLNSGRFAWIAVHLSKKDNGSMNANNKQELWENPWVKYWINDSEIGQWEL